MRLCVRLLWLLMVSASAAAQPLVLQHVTVIDGTDKPAQQGMTVVIDRGLIQEVGPSDKVTPPSGATLVDATGKYLIPGLWDMHVHGTSNAWSYSLYLANGVVGVREMWGPDDANSWRKEHSASREQTPTFYLGSPIIDGPKPIWPGSVSVSNDMEGRAAVDLYAQRGADFIKVYSRLTRSAYFAIADEARARGIPYAGHVPYAIRVSEASAAGQKSVEHLMGIALGTSSQEDALFADQPRTHAERNRSELRADESYDDMKAQALFAEFLKNGTWQCPTLTVLQAESRLDDPQFTSDGRLKYVPLRLRRSWDPRNDFRFKTMTAADFAVARQLFQHDLELVGRLYRAGVGIIAGTDTMNPFIFPGFSLHDELALLVQAGLPPAEALKAATSSAARFMGQLDRRGTVERGKIADLVLLDRDPLADIHNTQSIRAVVLGGQLIPRARIDRMLAQAESFAQSAPRLPARRIR